MTEPTLSLKDRRDLELGRFVDQFGYLESHLAVMTWAAVGVNPIDGPLITHNLRLSGTIELLRGVARVRLVPSLAERVSHWLSEVRSLAETRNLLMHSSWLEGEVPPGTPVEDVPFQKLNIGRATKRGSPSVSVSSLRASTSKAKALLSEAHALFIEIVEATWEEPTSPPF
jgi:hypothetical protein